MTVWYISDLHFGHQKVLDKRNRHKTLEEAQREVEEKWLAKVSPEDVVYIAGDIGEPELAFPSLQALPGTKYLLQGNHDAWLDETPRAEVDEVFADVQHMMVIDDGGRTVTLCHYPMLEWLRMHKPTSFMVHGHMHARKTDTYHYIQAMLPQVLNCGVDINDFAPVTLDELFANNARWYGRAPQEA